MILAACGGSGSSGGSGSPAAVSGVASMNAAAAEPPETAGDAAAAAATTVAASDAAAAASTIAPASDAAPAALRIASASDAAPATGTVTPEYPPEPIVEAAAIRHLYVSASGSDANPGTQALPFKTILKASQAATPGTAVHVAPGTYPGSFTTARSGTATARISYISDTRWGAKIVPPANSGLVAGWYNTGSYVDIIGFEIDGTQTLAGQRWTLGIMVRGGYNTIQANHVHHVATTSAACNSQGGSAINADTLNNGYQINFIGNVVHHIGVPGCQFIHGIYHSSSGQIKNNLIYQVGYGGIHLWHDASNIDIANNTIFATQYGIIVGAGDFYKSTTKKVDYVNVSNNIVYDNSTGIIEMGPTGSRNTYTNNLVFKNSRVNWALNSGHASDVTADPQFVSYNRDGGGDYSLRTTSPALGYGATAYAPSTDINGVARPQGGRIDIGAYELAGSGAR
jgi:parallel beta-helix repeat protein